MKYLIATILDKNQFDLPSLRSEELEDGVLCIKGMIPGQEGEEVQAIVFDTSLFDENAAHEWLESNSFKPLSIEEQVIEDEEMPEEPAEEELMEEEPGEEEKPEEKEMMEGEEPEDDEKKKKQAAILKKHMEKPEDKEEEDMKSYDLDGIEIMRTGVWNNTTFNTQDLDDMVAAFTETSKELKPYLKLGHNEGQDLLQSDGLPSAGWITSLKRDGESLMANIKNIPTKVYGLIKDKRYGRFSAEVYFDAFINDKPFRRALKAVALLGADTPAVSTMDDLINLYTKNEIKYSKVISTGEPVNLTQDEEIMIKKLAKENEELKSRLERVENNSKQEKVQAYINSQIEKGKILPTQADLYTTLMMDDTVRTFSHLDGEQLKTEKISTFSLVQKIVDSSPSLVDMETRSKDFKAEKPKSADDELDEKIQAYSKENKVDYNAAYEAVIRGEK